MSQKISPGVSPENFHVSLGSLFSGGSPIVPKASPVPSHERPVVPPDDNQGLDFSWSSEPEVSSEAPETTSEEKSEDENATNTDSKDETKNEDALSSEEVTASGDDELKDETTTDEEAAKPRKKHKKHKKKVKRRHDTSSETTTEPASEEQTSSQSEPAVQTEQQESTETGTSDVETTEESTEPVSSTSEEKAPSRENADWTLSEDCLLRSLKLGGETWADICAALNRSKSDAKSRWYVIKDWTPETDVEEPVAVTDNTEAESEMKPQKSDEQVKKGKVMRKKEKAKAKRATLESSSSDSSDSSIHQRKKRKGKGKAVAKAHRHKGPRNSKIAAENKKAKAKAARRNYDLSGDEASSELSSSSSALDEGDYGYGPEEKRRQKRYLVQNIWSGLYPPNIEIEPDEHFSKEDCDILASVESKYTRSKWLEMQANFYNVTGRMLPLSAIQAKCENAKKLEGEKEASDQKRLAKRLKRVEKWMKKVAREEVEDPES